MIDYASFEDDMVSRLTSLAPDIEVRALPENLQGDNRAVTKPRVTIGFKAANADEDYNVATSSGGRSRSIGYAVQEKAPLFEVLIQSRWRRGENGIFQVMQQVQDLLLGYMPLGAEPLKIVREGFIATNDNLWTYSTIFATTVPAIQVIPDPDDPPFVGATFDETIN